MSTSILIAELAKEDHAMSRESLEQFAEKLGRDEEWAAQYDELSPEAVIAHANEEGFDFTLDELNAAFDTEVAEVPDDDLEHVSGGAGRSAFSTGTLRTWALSLRARRSGPGYVRPGAIDHTPPEIVGTRRKR